MAPKKNKNKNKGKDSPDDDFSDDSSSNVNVKDLPDLTMIRNLFIGQVVTCVKIPNSQFLKVEIELPGDLDDLFVITTASNIEEDMKLIVAKAPCQLPNGMPVEVREIKTPGGEYDSEGMILSPAELKWPTGVFKPNQPIALPQAELTDTIPPYEECVELSKKQVAGGGGGKKKKKGKGGGGGDEEDDFAAALAEFGVVS